MSLMPVDPNSPAAVTHYLGEARRWLETAVETSTPHGIFNAKAEIATAAEATKQLGLSKEIQLDAQEMVRRAEYALGRSIRKGQAEGTVQTRADGAAVRDGTLSPGGDKVSSLSFFQGDGKKAREETYAMAESPDFDAAIDAAKAEGNLSRANVARKAREQSGQPARATRRTPLPDFARDAADDLLRIAERLQRISTDDRFAENREAIAHRASGSLNRSLQLINEFSAALNNEATS